MIHNDFLFAQGGYNSIEMNLFYILINKAQELNKISFKIGTNELLEYLNKKRNNLHKYKKNINNLTTTFLNLPDMKVPFLASCFYDKKFDSFNFEINKDLENRVLPFSNFLVEAYEATKKSK